jgi:hypothetical protein
MEGGGGDSGGGEDAGRAWSREADSDRPLLLLCRWRGRGGTAATESLVLPPSRHGARRGTAAFAGGTIADSDAERRSDLPGGGNILTGASRCSRNTSLADARAAASSAAMRSSSSGRAAASAARAATAAAPPVLSASEDIRTRLGSCAISSRCPSGDVDSGTWKASLLPSISSNAVTISASSAGRGLCVESPLSSDTAAADVAAGLKAAGRFCRSGSACFERGANRGGWSPSVDVSTRLCAAAVCSTPLPSKPPAVVGEAVESEGGSGLPEDAKASA